MHSTDPLGTVQNTTDNIVSKLFRKMADNTSMAHAVVTDKGVHMLTSSTQTQRIPSVSPVFGVRPEEMCCYFLVSSPEASDKLKELPSQLQLPELRSIQTVDLQCNS